MPRTAVVPVSYIRDSSFEVAAGTTIDATLVTNGVVITQANTHKLTVEVANTAAAPKNITIRAGVNPPALHAGQGNKIIAVANAKTHRIGPLTSMRFSQANGDLYIDLETGTTGTISAFLSP